MRLFWIILLGLPLTFQAQERVALVGGSASKASVAAVRDVNEEEVTRILDFELDGGIILVEAFIDQQPHTFVLDSGAPGLILNNFQSNGIKTSITGINGTMTAYDLILKNFSWADKHYPSIAATSMDLSRLESMTKRKISGLIGYDLLKDYELFLDYEKRVMQLQPHRVNIDEESVPLVRFPITFHEHLPVIEAEIAGQKLQLGLDTGAEINVLDQHISARIASAASDVVPYGKIYGVGNADVPSAQVRVSVTRIRRAAYREMNFVLTDLSGIMDRGMTKIDGILGFPFLSSCKFSIDFRKKEQKVWP